ncbi:DNA binding protein [Dorcoceras hygrometricum]|uniref:DNA binding protein n=1 Tax=Dorcoceras hygrometricum TaxID=472368 RepID=A0A2Z7AKX8_9LAMI|nr:DNA binding protein [Dorcoceras hygrometricum]
MQQRHSPEVSALHRFLSENGLSYCFPAMQSFCCLPDVPEMVDRPDEARGLAAAENHREAERKRRKRINSHLDRLRDILPCSSKTDKASLLAHVVQRVKELNQQTSQIKNSDQTIPSESDEVSITKDDNFHGESVVKASLCCEDRVDLIPELIGVLKSLNLIPLRAEMVTLGGRMKNVIILKGEKNSMDESGLFLRDELKRLVLSSANRGDGGNLKRRRRFDSFSGV